MSFTHHVADVPMPTIETSLVIFDCDGVLIDSEFIAARAQSRALADHGIAISPQDAARRFAGIPDRDMWLTFEKEHACELPQDFPKRYADQLDDIFKHELRALPGVVETLKSLQERQIKFCVASSSTPAKLESALSLVGLWDYFSPHVFSTSQVARGKPAPDIFLFAARKMGATYAQCLVVEDSVPGMQAAVAARMRGIGFIGASHNGPDQARRLLDVGAAAVINDLRLLPDYL